MNRLSLVLFVFWHLLGGIYCINANAQVNGQVIFPKETFDALIEVLQDDKSSFEEVYSKAIQFYDVALEMSRDKESLQNRILAQVLCANTLWDILDKVSANSDHDVQLSKIVDIVGEINNQWVFYESDGDCFLSHDNYFLSYKGTDYESDDTFTLEILFPGDESEGLLVSLDFPASASSPKEVLFSTIKDGQEDTDNLTSTQWKKTLPKDEEYPRVSALSDSELLDMMLKYDYMYFFFETEKNTADGNNMDSGRIVLKPFKDSFKEIVSKL